MGSFTSKFLSGFARLALYGSVAFALLINDVGAAEVEAYFTPGEGCEQRVVDLLLGSKTSIEVALHKLDSKKLIAALIEAKKQGKQVRVLLDSTQAKLRHETAVMLKESGISVRLHSVSRTQHNSFVIVDSIVVVTGTYDWTKIGDNKDENSCVFLREKSIVAKFIDRFEKHLWRLNTEEKSRRSFANIRVRVRDKKIDGRRPSSEASQ